jgi:hypothetical protein
MAILRKGDQLRVIPVSAHISTVSADAQVHNTFDASVPVISWNGVREPTGNFKAALQSPSMRGKLEGTAEVWSLLVQATNMGLIETDVIASSREKRDAFDAKGKIRTALYNIVGTVPKDVIYLKTAEQQPQEVIFEVAKTLLGDQTQQI